MCVNSNTALWNEGKGKIQNTINNNKHLQSTRYVLRTISGTKKKYISYHIILYHMSCYIS